MSSSTSGSTLASDFGVVGTSMEMLVFWRPFCAAISFPFGTAAFPDCFPFLVPSVETFFVVDLVTEPFMEVFVTFLTGVEGVVGALLELLRRLGALAAEIERRLGRDEVAVLLTFVFLLSFSDKRRLLFAGGAVASAIASALRFAGAIVKLLDDDRCLDCVKVRLKSEHFGAFEGFVTALTADSLVVFYHFSPFKIVH